MRVKILASASQDLIDGYHFYERQAEGLGDRYLDSLFKDIDALKAGAGIHPKFFEYYHRLLAHTFPFAIYYLVEADSVLVYAVLDCRRDPSWTREKLQ